MIIIHDAFQKINRDEKICFNSFLTNVILQKYIIMLKFIEVGDEKW